MTYSNVPSASKSKINKAGEILTNINSKSEEYEWARNLVSEWRACHAYPLNTFNVTLRDKVKKYQNTIVAQRLKRMPTIIDKLQRYPSMKLTTMQDIGGVRAIVKSIDDVYALASEYKDSSRFSHTIHNVKDYIQNPRDEDGYRSLHLMYNYKNPRAPEYNGLNVELQIRTKLQHTWATAVETMGFFLNQALKSRQGSKDWINFFAITSSAFAHIEKTNLIPSYANLTKSETNKEVSKQARKLNALDVMRGYSIAVKEIVDSNSQQQGWHYHLIILDTIEKSIRTIPYTRDSFDKAAKAYAKAEESALKDHKEVVLVSAGKLKELRKAYPNFFLDMSDFIKIIDRIDKTIS